MPGPKQGLVFISCGQFTATERGLGKELATLVDDLTDFEGYFAENQSSLEGLSRNILESLNKCCGFVAVMHHRSQVQTLDGFHTRGSVWVEQEIAIAAFIKQAIGRDLPVVAYIQKGIKREGIRDQLLLGAVEFETEQEVLTEFRRRLSQGQFTPMRIIPPKDVTLEFVSRQTSKIAEGLRNQLSIKVQNTGFEPLREYWVSLEFPKFALETGTISGEQKTRESPTHRFFRHTEKEIQKVIYPGDYLNFFLMDYFIRHNLPDRDTMLDQIVGAQCGSSGMSVRSIQKPLRGFVDG